MPLPATVPRPGRRRRRRWTRSSRLPPATATRRSSKPATTSRGAPTGGGHGWQSKARQTTLVLNRQGPACSAVQQLMLLNRCLHALCCLPPRLLRRWATCLAHCATPTRLPLQHHLLLPHRGHAHLVPERLREGPEGVQSSRQLVRWEHKGSASHAPAQVPLRRLPPPACPAANAPLPALQSYKESLSGKSMSVSPKDFVC